MKKIQFIILVFSFLFISKISLGQKLENKVLISSKQINDTTTKIVSKQDFRENLIIEVYKNDKQVLFKNGWQDLSFDISDFNDELNFIFSYHGYFKRIQQKNLKTKKKNGNRFSQLSFSNTSKIESTEIKRNKQKNEQFKAVLIKKIVYIYPKELSVELSNEFNQFLYNFYIEVKIIEEQTIEKKENTNLKFYLTDAKQTPVSLATLNFISTNDIPSLKFLKNIGNNDKTDNYGNYSLSEQLISKTDLKKSWSLIINPTKNLDTVTSIIVFDKDENKEYYLKKDSINRFVFDFGRESKINVEENKTTSTANKNSSNSINYKFVTNDAKQKPIVNNIAYVKTLNLKDIEQLNEIFYKLPKKVSLLKAGFYEHTTNNFGNLDKSFPDKKDDLYSFIVLEKTKQLDTLDELLVIDRLKNTKSVIKKDTSGYFVFNTSLQSQKEIVKQNEIISQNTNLKFYIIDTIVNKKTPIKNTELYFKRHLDENGKIITSYVIKNKSRQRKIPSATNNDFIDAAKKSTDQFGALHLSEKIIEKSELEKSWILYFKTGLNNDKIFIEDLDNDKDYILKKNENGYFVFDFGRTNKETASKKDSISSDKTIVNAKMLLKDEKNNPLQNIKIMYNDSRVSYSSKATNAYSVSDNKGFIRLNDAVFEDSLRILIPIFENEKLNGLTKIILTNLDGEKVAELTKLPNEATFQFTFLPYELKAFAQTVVEEPSLIIKSTELKLTEVETQKPISNQKVIYSDADGLKQNTSTNTEGVFAVQNISTQNFEIELEKNEKLIQIKSIVVSTTQGKKISELKKNSEGTFKYTFLPNELAVLSEIENTDTQLNIVKSTELKLTEAETQKPISNQKVIYNDANGKKQNTSTNNDGVFKVENISEKNFAIELEKNENLNSISSIRVSNKKGVTITEIKKNNQTSFEYTFLPSDFIKLSEITNDDVSINTIKSTELKLTDTETKKPISNQKVMYNDVDGKKQNTSTNTDGIFTVKNVSTENLQLELENNAKLKSILKISISTKQGDKISEMQKSPEGTFKYTFLKSELSVLKELSNNDDVALKVNTFQNNDNNELKIKKQIYFDLASAELNNNAKTELDGISQILSENPTLQLEIIAHTDARGDDATNLTLSEKRAANSVSYLISKGIKTERLKSKGMGEKEILNQCTNNITCSELEHALNRRTEFRFLKN
ncbi:MAG: OmpA family protein [Bacteroidota bacterium]